MYPVMKYFQDGELPIPENAGLYVDPTYSAKADPTVWGAC